MKEYSIRHRKSSPYHPQANGQAEVTNREIAAILTKIVQLHKKDWSIQKNRGNICEKRLQEEER